MNPNVAVVAANPFADRTPPVVFVPTFESSRDRMRPIAIVRTAFASGPRRAVSCLSSGGPRRSAPGWIACALALTFAVAARAQTLPPSPTFPAGPALPPSGAPAPNPLPPQYAQFGAEYRAQAPSLAGVPASTPGSPTPAAPNPSGWQPPTLTPEEGPPEPIPAPDPMPPTWPDYEDTRPGFFSWLLQEPFWGSTGPQPGCCDGPYWGDGEEPWVFQVLPTGLIYRSYLAGRRESRMAFFTGKQNVTGNVWEATLGGRVAILRYGTTNPIFPEGWEIDVEGASFSRLDPIVGPQDLIANDYRFGLPITYGRGKWQYKFAIWHLSSHLGDEYMVRQQSFDRINYVRNAFVVGVAWTPVLNIRTYAEVGWAFHTNGGAKPWETQFGIEYRPGYATGLKGAPFAAVDAHLLEDRNFNGNFVAQTGWAWRGVAGQIFRLGVEYVTGTATQYSFEGNYEQQIGFAVWYDF